MTSRRPLLLALLLPLLLLGGCRLAGVRSYFLTSHVVNDDNKLLAVEGFSDLPDGALIQAALYDDRGHRLTAGQAVLRQGDYYVVLDISRLSGTSRYRLKVWFDPLLAPPSVQRQVGHRGQAMWGQQVAFEDGRQILVDRSRVVLMLSPKEAAFRELANGDLEQGIRGLESQLSAHPHDAAAMLQLARAYLRADKAEHQVGSRAYKLLQQVVATAPDSAGAATAGRLIARLESQQHRRESVLAFKKAAALGPGSAFDTDRTVIPGQALGAVRLGMPYQDLVSRFAPDNLPTFAHLVATVRFSGFHDLEVGVDARTQEVVWASSGSKFFHLDAKLGVGSLLLAFRERFPALVTPAYGRETVLPDGTRQSFGTTRLPGLVLVVKRTRDPVVGIPVDTVARIRVVPMGSHETRGQTP